MDSIYETFMSLYMVPGTEIRPCCRRAINNKGYLSICLSIYLSILHLSYTLRECGLFSLVIMIIPIIQSLRRSVK